jgi:hypothetical protein
MPIKENSSELDAARTMEVRVVERRMKKQMMLT